MNAVFQNIRCEINEKRNEYDSSNENEWMSDKLYEVLLFDIQVISPESPKGHALKLRHGYK